MNKFFKTFWAALLAFIVGTVLMWLFVILLFSGIAASFSPKPTVVSAGSVLKIDLASTMVDSPENRSASINLSSYTATGSVTLLNAIQAIEKAAIDNNIKGIYMNLTGAGRMDITQIEEVRAALGRFKQSGKFIVSYDEAYSQTGYYFCSVADHVFLHPEGGISWQGMAGSVMFYKGLLDKLGIEMQILRHGTYKSAVEPFMTDRMSPANREQLTVMVNSLWDNILEEVSVSRGIPMTTLKGYADELSLAGAMNAKRLGFVDELMYEDQVNSYLAALVKGDTPASYTSAEESKAPKMVSLEEYVSTPVASGRRMSRNKVAVIYAEGDIMDGESYRGTVGGATVAAKIAEARRDDGVKAVVLRVNSPGGSAMASDVIWREVELLRKEKPVVVSMGRYAASGGYYIACNADVILANRSTLTGSIGVFGMIPNIGKTMKDKVGITVDVVRTNQHADMGNLFRSLDKAEEEYFLKGIETVYDTFVNHVADGRNMTYEAVDRIGEGRVWLGTDAHDIGLVDGFGGIKEAIELAADRAGIADDFRIYEMAETYNPFSLIMSAMYSARTPKIENELGEAFKHYNYLMNTVTGETTVQARMPYMIEFR